MNGEQTISRGPDVRCELRKDGTGRLVLVLGGQLDTDSVHPLWQELKLKLAASPVTNLQIDATALTQCDSAGFWLLYHLSTGQMTSGAPVSLSGLKPELQKVAGDIALQWRARQHELTDRTAR